jgi:hypothetical protein
MKLGIGGGIRRKRRQAGAEETELDHGVIAASHEDCEAAYVMRCLQT